MRRILTAVGLAALLAGGLAGCASAGGDAAAAERAFLDALREGDGPAALALTDFDGDLGCEQMISQYGDLTVGISIPEVGSVTVNGDRATAEFSYTVVSGGEAVEVSGAHTLVRADGGWLVEFPEEYRLTATVPADVVIEVSVHSRLSAEPVCVTPEPGDAFDVIALPGDYTINVGDPRGVFHPGGRGGSALVSDTEAGSVELDYIDEQEREIVALSVYNELSSLVSDCVTSGFHDAVCPDGLPVPDASVTIARANPDRFTDTLEVTAIFSTDGVNWRFTAGGAQYLFQRDGVDESFPIEFSGAIIRDADDRIAVVLD